MERKTKLDIAAGIFAGLATGLLLYAGFGYFSAPKYGFAPVVSQQYYQTPTSTNQMSNLLPAQDATYDLGNPVLRWRNLYVSNGASLPSGTLVGGKTVCASDGTNCTNSSVTGTVGTLQQVAWNGRSATGTFVLYDGLSTVSSTVTSTLTALNFNFTNASGMNASTTNLYAMSSASLPSGATIGGQLSCLANGSNCPSSYSGLTITSATTTNATSTNIAVTGLATLNNVAINGTCTGSGCASGGNQTLAQVTALGNSATVTLALYGGETVGSTLTATGTTSLQGVTMTNATATNVTTTGLYVSGLALLPLGSTVNSSAICTLNGANCPSGTTPPLQTVLTTGAITTIYPYFYGGMDAGGALTSTGTLAFAVSTGTSVTSTYAYFNNLFVNGVRIDTNGGTGGASNLQTVSLLGATSTASFNLYNALTVGASFSVTGTSFVQSLTMTSATATAVTSTSLYVSGLAQLPSGSTVGGQNVCLKNGTNCPVVGSQTLDQTLSFGNTTNHPIYTSSTVMADGLFSFGQSTGTSVSSTYVYANNLFVNGTRVCRADGTNCLISTTSTLQGVTDAGKVTTDDIQFAGGTSTADLYVQALAYLASATGTSVTSTYGFFNNLYVNGVQITGNGGSGSTPQIDAVLTAGSTTTHPLFSSSTLMAVSVTTTGQSAFKGGVSTTQIVLNNGLTYGTMGVKFQDGGALGALAGQPALYTGDGTLRQLWYATGTELWGNLMPGSATNGYDLGVNPDVNPGNDWAHIYGRYVSSSVLLTYSTAAGGILNASSYVTSTAGYFGSLSVNGSSACLANGTNCPSSYSTLSITTLSGTSITASNVTSTSLYVTGYLGMGTSTPMAYLSVSSTNDTHSFVSFTNSLGSVMFKVDSSGNVTMNGTSTMAGINLVGTNPNITVNGFDASSTIVLTGAGCTVATTNGAYQAIVESATNKENTRVCVFDATTTQYASWDVWMPRNWDGLPLSVKFVYSSTGTAHDATLTNVVWGLQAIGYAASTTIDQAFGTPVYATATMNGLANVTNAISSPNMLTIGGTVAGGEEVNFRVFRNAASPDDNYSNSANIRFVEIKYGMNAYSN